MGYYYLDLEKKNEKDFPSNKKYICIAEIPKPSPPTGKKTILKADRDEYNEKIEKQKLTFKAFEQDIVNMNNNSIKPDDIMDFGIRCLFSGFKNRVFHIEPIQSKKEWKNDIYYVSEFKVTHEIMNDDELLTQLVSDNDHYLFMPKVFEQGTYANDGYREKSIEVIRKINERSGSKCCLDDLIRGNYTYPYEDCSVKRLNDNAHDFAKELIDNGLVILVNEYSLIYTLVERLLRLKWTDLALEVIKSEFVKDSDITAIKERKYIREMLSLLTDDKHAREIIKLLNIDTGVITLIVKEVVDDGYSEQEIDRKEFTDMNDLRAYLITEYHVPFNMASGEINDMYHDYMYFSLEQS